jgi:hypothetical protein
MARRRESEVEKSIDAAEEEEGYVEDQSPVQSETEDVFVRVLGHGLCVCDRREYPTSWFVQITTFVLDRCFALDPP